MAHEAVPHMKNLLLGIAKAAQKTTNKHVTADRITALFLGEAAKNPILYETLRSPEGRGSIAVFFQLCTQLGLEPGSARGLVYPTPRRDKNRNWTILPVVGYRGFCELARRSGEILRINAGVFSLDDIEDGLVEVCHEPPKLIHKWSPDALVTEENLAGAYCVVELKDGGRAQWICTRADIDATQKRSPTGNKGFSPWKTDYPAMARKTAIRRLLNSGLVPLAVEVATALENDGDAPQVLDVPFTAAPTEQAVDQAADNARRALGYDPVPDRDYSRENTDLDNTAAHQRANANPDQVQNPPPPVEPPGPMGDPPSIKAECESLEVQLGKARVDQVRLHSNSFPMPNAAVTSWKAGANTAAAYLDALSSAVDAMKGEE